MSLTRKYLNTLVSGFNTLIHRANPEASQTTKDEAKHIALKIEVLDCEGDVSCRCKCCKTPNLVNPLITKPFYYTTAFIFGAIGLTALPVTLAIDGFNRCHEEDDATTILPSHSTNVNKENEEELLLQRSESDSAPPPLKPRKRS